MSYGWSGRADENLDKANATAGRPFCSILPDIECWQLSCWGILTPFVNFYIGIAILHVRRILCEVRPE